MSLDLIRTLTVIALVLSWNVSHADSTPMDLSWTVTSIWRWMDWWIWCISLPRSFVATFAFIQCFRLAATLKGTMEPTEGRQILQFLKREASSSRTAQIFLSEYFEGVSHHGWMSEKLNGLKSWFKVLMANYITKIIMDGCGLSCRKTIVFVNLLNLSLLVVSKFTTSSRSA